MNDDASHAPEPSGAPDSDVPFDERHLPKCSVSDELLHAGRDPRPGRAQRGDGWTPDRIRIVLFTLAACGVVSDAAKAAGMSVRSAYYLRSRAEGGPFNIAWNAALLLARRRLTDTVASRALHGCVEVVFRDGVVVGERHRYDNRLTMQVLTLLEHRAQSNDDESRAARFVLQEFGEFVEIVSRGGIGAAEFIDAREQAETRPAVNDAARNLERLENFWRYGAGISEPPEAAEHESDSESEDPIDCSASLEEADRDEALRRYYRWKSDDASPEEEMSAAPAGDTEDPAEVETAEMSKAASPSAGDPKPNRRTRSARAGKPKAARKPRKAKAAAPAPDPEAVRRYYRWKDTPETP
jgi:hypothetical protein